MYSETEFTADFRSAYAPTEHSRAGVCYQVYRNAYNAELRSLVIGRIVRPAKDPGAPPMIGIDEIERTNFGATSERSEGSVLWSQWWSLSLNDSWLLGGIHAALPFYLASPRSSANIESAEFGMSVTGRELIGITSFGYAMNPNTQLGEVFECKERSKAQSASLTRYVDAFERARQSGDWRKLVA